MSPNQQADRTREDDEEDPSHGNVELEMASCLVSPSRWSSDPPTQHISNVLGDALSARRRRDHCYTCLSEQPSPLCNLPAIVLSLVIVALCGLLFIQVRHRQEVLQIASTAAPTAEGDSSLSPEGRIYGDISMTHDYQGQSRLAYGSHGVVAADHGRCSELGVTILRSGGNAVDAAVATALCQGIYNPQASGIGGGGFMTIRAPNGSVEIIDARELAPAAASTNMYAGKASIASLEGGLAIAAPLELKGLWLAHQRHGRLPWADLVRPAGQLARTGFPAHPYLINALNGGRLTLLKYPEMRRTFYIREGQGDAQQWRTPRVNETCCARPALATLLDKVAVFGPSAVDDHAQELAAEIQAAGGIVTAADLVDAQPTVKQPLQAEVLGLTLLLPPPPSSGACVILALQILAGYQLPPSFAGALGAHRLVEALKHAFALRQALGDPGTCPGTCFLNVTSMLDDMLSSAFAASLRNATNDAATSTPGVYGGRWHVDAAAPDDHGTSHFSVVDSQQGAVAMTTTVNTGFGSKLLSPSTGILLNNQMDDFSQPGAANTFGLEPSAANYILPGRKPLSSMAPTLVLGPGGQLRAVLGASGGPRIISTILTVLLRLIAFGDDPLVAVGMPRLHHQLFPDNVIAEEWSSGGLSMHVDQETLQALRRRGHNVTSTTWSGVSQAVVIDPDSGVLTGVSDPRKDGAPSAF